MSADRSAWSRDGALRRSGLFDEDALAAIDRFAAAYPESPGIRLNALPSAVWDNAPIRAAVHDLVGTGARPVRAILFDKTASHNWPLGWHQDRTVAVRERRDVAGFAHWTMKDGVPHAEPPFALIERMVTTRIHLDPVDADNAPLLVALGSHRHGRIPEHAISTIVASSEILRCHAARGETWMYATAILHASEPAARPRRRRVLQIDWSPDRLPGGLAWAGVMRAA
ncbi:phytanoyl-CoA dioxygenase family protein [Sphingomonas sp.]|uniref:phytanoyl-CoA dioxygenase family protein n=1 Tax=Sphingomonas sp. TaxID=28214 RepID=UPI003B3B27A6